MSAHASYFYIDGKQFHSIMNASGCHSKYKEQLDSLIDSGMTTIITKSCTLHENTGNPTPNFKEVNVHTSINCLGMPNLGYNYYKNLLVGYYKKGITYIISMDASHWGDLKTMLLDYDAYVGTMKQEMGIQDGIREFVEINASCPNKLGLVSGQITRIIAYDPTELSRLLENIKNLQLANIHIGLKLSPYVDKLLLGQIGSVITRYSSIVKYIVCGNSIPNGMIIDLDTGKPYLSVKTGGISGTANKLLGVANVYQFNEIFKMGIKMGMGADISIIGCGGIETVDDSREYLLAGAKGVQIGRILYTSGTDAFRNIMVGTNVSCKL